LAPVSGSQWADSQVSAASGGERIRKKGGATLSGPKPAGADLEPATPQHSQKNIPIVKCSPDKSRSCPKHWLDSISGDSEKTLYACFPLSCCCSCACKQTWQIFYCCGGPPHARGGEDGHAAGDAGCGKAAFGGTRHLFFSCLRERHRAWIWRLDPRLRLGLIFC